HGQELHDVEAEHGPQDVLDRPPEQRRYGNGKKEQQVKGRVQRNERPDSLGRNHGWLEQLDRNLEEQQRGHYRGKPHQVRVVQLCSDHLRGRIDEDGQDGRDDQQYKRRHANQQSWLAAAGQEVINAVRNAENRQVKQRAHHELDLQIHAVVLRGEGTRQDDAEREDRYVLYGLTDGSEGDLVTQAHGRVRVRCASGVIVRTAAEA